MAPKASADPQALLPTLSGSAPKARWALELPPGAGWRFGVALLKDITSMSLCVVVREIGEWSVCCTYQSHLQDVCKWKQKYFYYE